VEVVLPLALFDAEAFEVRAAAFGALGHAHSPNLYRDSCARSSKSF
jgi:hypothetical protein